MELKGETLIAAPRERVWAALNDPDVLARCIDGLPSNHNDIKRVPAGLKAEWTAQLQALANGA